MILQHGVPMQQAHYCVIPLESTASSCAAEKGLPHTRQHSRAQPCMPPATSVRRSSHNIMYPPLCAVLLVQCKVSSKQQCTSDVQQAPFSCPTSEVWPCATPDEQPVL